MTNAHKRLLLCRKPYTSLSGESVQFEDGKSGTEMIVTTSEDTVVTRCGRNLWTIDYSDLPFEQSGITVDKDSSGNIIINGMPTITSGYVSMIVGASLQKLILGDDYTISVSNKLNGIGITMGAGAGAFNFSMSDAIKVKTSAYYSGQSLVGNTIINVRSDVDQLTDYILNPQFELGSVVHPYEPYNGQTYTITANTPTKIPLLDGCNTVFASNGTIHVRYLSMA